MQPSELPRPVSNGLSEVSHLQDNDNQVESSQNVTFLSLPTSPSQCIDYALPAGILVIMDPTNPNNNRTVTLQAPAVFRPNCALAGNSSITRSEEELPDWGEYQKHHDDGRRDPFYGSVTPIAYTIAASTVTAWMLLIILFLSRKPSPLFQKVAVLITAVSLTVFLAQATNILKDQYDQGYQNAYELRHAIMGGLEFRTLQVVACVIIWLARLQVVVRLFDVPKINTRLVVVGSTLIFANAAILGCLNFVPPWSQYVRHASSVLPVFGTLCALLLEVFYLVVVVIYSISKRRYAYSRTSIVMAVISWVTMILPMVFVILDIAHYWIAGWSDFIRWTADAAAAVVVWEWTNVIVYQERREQRQSVLGRQVYRDEILDFKGGNRGGTVGGGRTKYPSRMDDDDESAPYSSSPNDHHFTSNIPTSAGEGQPFKFFKKARLPRYSRKIWKIARGESAASNATNYEHAIMEEDEEIDERQRRTPTVDEEDTYGDFGVNGDYEDDLYTHSSESDLSRTLSGGHVSETQGHSHGHVHHNSESASSDSDSDSMASFSIIHQTGFTVDTHGVPEYDADACPPTFEPIPGFHRQDYSDEKA